MDIMLYNYLSKYNINTNSQVMYVLDIAIRMVGRMEIGMDIEAK